VTALFVFRREGVTVAEAGMPAVAAQQGVRLFFEAAGEIESGAPGAFSTGFAVSNPNGHDVSVALNLVGADGRALVPQTSIRIPAYGQRALFVSQVPGWNTLSLPTRGSLIVSANDPIAVTGLRGRYNERTDFLISFLPASPLAERLASTEIIFPHFADGGGYSTQFVLLDPEAAERISGSVQFHSANGEPLLLEVR
jgi:hypothetical protein